MCFIYAFIEVKNDQRLVPFFFLFFENQRLGFKSIKFYNDLLHSHEITWNI